ncbi:MAG: histidine--tRNA ligase [Acidimicrobiales bacterium]
MSPAPFQAPIGTHDVAPPESGRWQSLVARFAQAAGRAGYGLLQSPLFEEVGVFQRLGEETDVVGKEMYVFEDRGGRRLALRPEGTAPVARAFVQRRPPLPWKVWYATPSFRYERPQAGRYRQHHQVGIEALGSADPDLDVEVVTLAWDLLADLGLGQVALLVNSMGDQTCRPAYLAGLARFLGPRREGLCDDHRERVAANPLRALDCKRDACREATVDAPRLVDALCRACAEHFERVRAGLGELGVAARLDARLVRGLDYYTRTTFELQAPALAAAQSTVAAGGRYDGLVEALGGPPTPGVGFGLGIERTLLACDAEGAFPPPPSPVEVWVVDIAGGQVASQLTTALRRAGIGADRAFDGRSMRSQMKLADRSGARLALIVGEEEVAKETVTVRALRGAGEQDTVTRDQVVAAVRRRLAR